MIVMTTLSVRKLRGLTIALVVMVTMVMGHLVQVGES